MQKMQEMWVGFLGWEEPLEKEMGTHSSRSPEELQGLLPSQPAKLETAVSLRTHLHEHPVAVHLLGSLEKVAPVSPHGRMFFCDDGCAWRRGAKE